MSTSKWGELLSAPVSSALYDRWVAIDTNYTTNPTILAVANSLQGKLANITGVEFTASTTKTTGRGIFLLRNAGDLTTRYPALASAASDLAVLATKSIEGFLVYSNNADNLFIVGNSDTALNSGAYYYLRQLGWQSLLPGSKWTIKPQLDSITLTIDTVQEPNFRLHDFFGTGGFGANLPLDPTAQVAAEWAAWKSANLFGGSISLGGHSGQVFNASTYTPPGQSQNITTQMQTNAALRAWNSQTMHYPYSESVKWDPSNPQLQLLYTEWVKNQYNPNAFAVSVEPADGGAYSIDSVNTQYDPESSQVFGLAKLAADALKAAHPAQPNMVSLLAYAGHAGIPNDPALYDTGAGVGWLEDPNSNVFVQVVPYGFQRTGLSGDQLATAWADAKPNNLGMYDYVGIPDWSQGLPTEQFALHAHRLALIKDLGYDSYLAESTYGGGTVGVLQSMLSQLTWDPTVTDANVQAKATAIRQQFYSMAFGPAAAPMSRMIERWGAGFALTANQVGFAMQDIAAARTLATNDPAALARVNDYAKYVQYVRLFYEYQTAVTSGVNVHAAADAVMKWMWQINSSDMVQSYRINELLTKRWQAGDATLVADWDVTNPNAAGWTYVKNNPLTDTMLTNVLSSGLMTYAGTTPNHVVFDQPAYSGYSVATNTTALVPMNPNYSLAGSLTAHTPLMYGEYKFAFYAKPGVTSIPFAIYIGTGSPTAYTTITISDPNGNVVFSGNYGGTQFGGGNTSFNFNAPTLTSGTYTMNVYDQKKNFQMFMDPNLPFVVQGSMATVSQTGWNSYFYVPPAVSTIGLYTSNVTPLVVTNGSGGVVSPSWGTGISESDYAVAAGQDNRVWGLANAKATAFALNVPSNFSFSTTDPSGFHGMMIPVNVGPRADAGNDATIISPTNQALLAGKAIDDHMSATAPYVTSLWSKVSGPSSVSFGSASSLSTTVTFGATGTYVLRLTATDTNGLVSTDDVTIDYLSTSPNTPPVVNTGADQTITLPGTATLTGTATDDGKPTPPGAITYWWTHKSGPGHVSFANPSALSTTATFEKPGTYVLRLTASDSALVQYDEMTVTVKRDYNSPTFNYGDTAVIGTPASYTSTAPVVTFSTASPTTQFSARFQAQEAATINQVYQKFVGGGAGAQIEVGIMADNGSGSPTGTYLASTAPYAQANGSAWSPAFTSSLALTPGQVYHVVTKVTTMVGASFMIYGSAHSTSMRPYDNGTDTNMDSLVSSNGGTSWGSVSKDPYFALGFNGVAVAGPGNVQNGLLDTFNGLVSTGGTGRAVGQKFVISPKEAPSGGRVTTNAITLYLARNAATTKDLIVNVVRADGVTMATATVPVGSIGTSTAPATTYTATFNKTLELFTGQTYFITTQLAAGSTTSDIYYMGFIHSDAATNAANYGGTTVNVPILSGTFNNWAGLSSASYTAHQVNFDMFFQFSGNVIAAPVYNIGATASVGNFDASFNHNGVGITMDGLNDTYSARFQTHESMTIDRIIQRLIGIDANTRIEVGIQADDGTGRPDGRYLASTLSMNPADGNSSASAVLTQPVTLDAYKVYHVVTRITSLSGGESFMVYRSTGNSGIRPSDNSLDASMSVLTSVNGGAWAVQPFDPYFAFANGATVLPGAGQPNVGAVTSHLVTTGGTGTAAGQQFQISPAELPAGASVHTTGITLPISKGGSPTDPVLVRIRSSTGTILATATVPVSSADGVSRFYAWDVAATVDLKVGTTYLLTMQFGGAGGTTGQTYNFLATYTEAGNGKAGWGGQAVNMPIVSGPSNNWATWSVNAGRLDTDAVFHFGGTVVSGTP